MAQVFSRLVFTRQNFMGLWELLPKINPVISTMVGFPFISGGDLLAVGHA